ncbi:MAG TPA: hypothetical protein VK738_20550 [Terriglobales bacterium]|jgi:hypothetical protein|nr:hypothetical protein [Terriglobales bacterium]
METRTKALWIVTTANAIVAILLILVIYATMLALAVLAPEISGWPLFILLAVGLTKYKEQDLSRYLHDHPDACSIGQSRGPDSVARAVFSMGDGEKTVSELDQRNRKS